MSLVVRLMPDINSHKILDNEKMLSNLTGKLYMSITNFIKYHLSQTPKQ